MYYLETVFIKIH